MKAIEAKIVVLGSQGKQASIIGAICNSFFFVSMAGRRFPMPPDFAVVVATFVR